MRTVFFIPPLKKISGGLASLSELANMLSKQGNEVAVVSPQKDCPAMALLAPEIPRLAWGTGKGGFLASDDIWCIPDGWPNALVPGAQAGARTLMYVQSWVFMLGSLSEGMQWRQLPLSYLAVSRPVQWVLKNILGLESVGILPPSVRGEFFTRRERPENRIRIAWMPRKNRALAEQIQSVASAFLATEGKGIRTEYVEIHGLSSLEVAELLGGCHIFLSTGFPEGFALPPAEAMASGCIPVGFSGMGGFEYMRNPETPPVPGLFKPPFSLEKKDWGQNGLFVSDGDVLSAGMALAYAVEAAWLNRKDWQSFRTNAVTAAKAYCTEKRQARIATLWPDRVAHIPRQKP